jgi:hypothetical protein
MGDEIDGAIQQAAQPGRQFMVIFSSYLYRNFDDNFSD